MKSTILACLAALTLAACGGGGDDTPDTPDADTAAPDAGLCTGAAYDSCTDTVGSTDCLDGMACRLFMQQGITICTPMCDASNPCPEQDGAAVSCNMMGRCRGEAANACTLP